MTFALVDPLYYNVLAGRPTLLWPLRWSTHSIITFALFDPLYYNVRAGRPTLLLPSRWSTHSIMTFALVDPLYYNVRAGRPTKKVLIKSRQKTPVRWMLPQQEISYARPLVFSYYINHKIGTAQAEVRKCTIKNTHRLSKLFKSWCWMRLGVGVSTSFKHFNNSHPDLFLTWDSELLMSSVNSWNWKQMCNLNLYTDKYNLENNILM